MIATIVIKCANDKNELFVQLEHVKKYIKSRLKDAEAELIHTDGDSHGSYTLDIQPD